MIYILDIAIKTYREAISFPKLVIQLGALYGKFVSCGGMTYSVFIKLYESSVESTLGLLDVLRIETTQSKN
jgi:hypothetical protein